MLHCLGHYVFSWRLTPRFSIAQGKSNETIKGLCACSTGFMQLYLCLSHRGSPCLLQYVILQVHATPQGQFLSFNHNFGAHPCRPEAVSSPTDLNFPETSEVQVWKPEVVPILTKSAPALAGTALLAYFCPLMHYIFCMDTIHIAQGTAEKLAPSNKGEVSTNMGDLALLRTSL